MSAIKKFIASVLVTVCAFYMAAVGYLYIAQDSMIFPAPEMGVTNAGDAIFEQIEITTPDGERLFALHHKTDVNSPSNPPATIIVLHGNRGSAFGQKRRGRILADAGFGVLLLEYRGYPGSTGIASENGLFIDAKAGFDYLSNQGVRNIGLYAHSLGTGVATYLASERKTFAIVLEAPFDALVNVAAKRYPWVPVYPLTKHKFRSDQYIAEINAPILIMHGDQDRTVPIEHGRRLAELAPKATTEFITFEGLGHGCFSGIGAEKLAIQFFNSALDER